MFPSCHLLYPSFTFTGDEQETRPLLLTLLIQQQNNTGGVGRSRMPDHDNALTDIEAKDFFFNEK